MRHIWEFLNTVDLVEGNLRTLFFSIETWKQKKWNIKWMINDQHFVTYNFTSTFFQFLRAYFLLNLGDEKWYEKFVTLRRIVHHFFTFWMLIKKAKRRAKRFSALEFSVPLLLFSQLLSFAYKVTLTKIKVLILFLAILANFWLFTCRQAKIGTH